MFVSSVYSLATALLAISAAAAPLERRANPDDPYGKGTFQLIGIAAGPLYEYGGLWVNSASDQNIAVMTQNQSLADAFKYHPKTGDVYYNVKSGNTTTPYSITLENSPINDGPAGYNYVSINAGYAHSNLSFIQGNNEIEMHWPGETFAVCFEIEGPSPGLGLLWRNSSVNASSSCLDVSLKAIFNH